MLVYEVQEGKIYLYYNCIVMAGKVNMTFNYDEANDTAWLDINRKDIDALKLLNVAKSAYIGMLDQMISSMFVTLADEEEERDVETIAKGVAWFISLASSIDIPWEKVKDIIHETVDDAIDKEDIELHAIIDASFADAMWLSHAEEKEQFIK